MSIADEIKAASSKKMDNTAEEQKGVSRDSQHKNVDVDSQHLKGSADFLPDSVYFVNRQNKSKSSVVVLDGDLGKASPLEWDEWTTNSDESSTISVVMQPGYGKTGLVNDDDFQTSSSFEFQSKQKNEANEPNRSYADFEKDILTSRLKHNADDLNRKKYSPDFLEEKNKSTSVINISDRSPRNNLRTQSRDLNEQKKSDKSDYVTRYRNLAPKIEEPEQEPGEGKLQPREYSPSYRDLPRSRDSSATRFVAIDAYLGLKDNSSPDPEEIREMEKCREREERREIRRIEMEVMEERRQKRELERGEKRFLNSLERNKESGARQEESRRREPSKGREEENVARGEQQGADKDIKEDLCSSLLTIKNASVSPEERRYSEVYLTGLKRLTASESDSKDKQEKFYGSASTDDSKSWYQSKMSDNKLASDQGTGKSPRSVTPVNREQGQSDNKPKAEMKNGESSIPGFLSKTQQFDVEKKLDQDIHFDSEFPTFSAYLKRTYGQSYTYRTRESSETSEKGEKLYNEERNLKSVDDSKRMDIERNRANDLSYEYSISDKASQKINEQHKYKASEHISRKANFDIDKEQENDVKVMRVSNKDDPLNIEDPNDSNSFLSRSKESIYESSGSAPHNTECFSKQLIKNTAVTKSKSSKNENRDASPTIDLLKRSFESLQYALNNKELELMSPKACQDLRRDSPSPERTPEPNERLSDSSQSRSRSRTKKRTVQSQSRSRESSQKMRLKEIAPTFYEAKYNGGLDKRSLDREDRIMRNEELYLSERGFHPQNNVHSDSLRGAEVEHFSHLNQRYAEKYPMDLNDEDISVMKKFIHHKKDELPSELFCMDVETFKKLYVQNRVLEMKREASVSRRSSITSNINELEILNRNQKKAGNQTENDPPCPELGDALYNSPKGSRRPDQIIAEIPAHTPIEYGSPKKKNVAVQMQVSNTLSSLVCPACLIWRVLRIKSKIIVFVHFIRCLL